MITIYYGEGSTLDDAETLAQRIQEAAPGLEAVDVPTAASRTTGT